MLKEPNPKRTGLAPRRSSSFYDFKKKIRFVTRKRKPSKAWKETKKAISKGSRAISDEIWDGLTT